MCAKRGRSDVKARQEKEKGQKGFGNKKEAGCRMGLPSAAASFFWHRTSGVVQWDWNLMYKNGAGWENSLHQESSR